MQGLCGKRYNKLHSPELIQIFKENLVILLTETWTNEFSETHVDGFYSFVLNRTLKHTNAKRDSGGLIIYVSNKLSGKVSLVKYVSDCIIWIKFDGCLFTSQDPVYMGLCYNTPEGSSREIYNDKSIFEMISDDIISFEEQVEGRCSVFVCGDLNARTGVRNDFVENDSDYIVDLLPDNYITDQALPRYSEDRVCNDFGNCLLDLCKSTGLRIVNGRVGEDKFIGKVTCVKGNGKSLVDYVLCKHELFSMLSEFEVYEPNILSDHCMIRFCMLTDKIQDENINLPEGLQSQSYTYKWDETKLLEYLDNLSQPIIVDQINDITESLSEVTDAKALNENLDVFYDVLSKVCDPLFKKKVKSNDSIKSKNTDQPWYDDDCKSKRKDFYKNLNFYRNDKCEENRTSMTAARSRYKCAIRSNKFKYDKMRTSKLERARFQNAKEYWKMLKGLTENSTVKTLSADVFADYFKAINDPNDVFFQPDDDAILFNERYVNGEFQIMFEELNVNLTEAEILKAVNQLKLGKAGGPDNLVNEFFRYGIDVLMPYLHKLFNTVFDIGCFPDKWTDGFIIPLHKKGNKNDVENYRGITLLSTFGKLFSKIINNRLDNWAENYYVYIEAQAGFRRQMGTVDNIFVLHSLIKHFVNEGKRLYAAFIDFTKAFDYIVRENLWLKLIKTGVRGKLLNVIKSMYTSVKAMVRYNNQLSEEFSCYLGVRQGECLSPFLFSIYLNDIEAEFVQNNFKGIETDMLKLFLLLYADDIVLFASDEYDLQKGLDVLHTYCLKWKLKVNVNKTKIMVFRSGGILRRNLTFLYDGQVINIVQNFTARCIKLLILVYHYTLDFTSSDNSFLISPLKF